MEQVIIELINKLPQWVVIIGVVVWGVHKMCNNQLKHISRIVGKNLLRSTNELKKINETNIKQEEHLKNIDDKISKNAEDIRHIKETFINGNEINERFDKLENKVFGEKNEK